MECGARQLFNLDTQQKRAKFLESKTKKQTSMESFFPGNFSSTVGGGRTPAPVPASFSSTRDTDEEKKVNLMIITKIVLDMDPFCLMDRPGMVFLMNSAFPKYTIRSRKYYSELLHKVYKNGKEKIKKKLDEESISTLAVQMDGWSKFGHGYVGVVLTFITKGWKRVTLAIDTIPFDESHTAPAQAELLQNVLEEWGLVLPFKYLTTDSASNMTAMEAYLEEAEMIKCLNHVLQLVINDEILMKPEIKELLARIKKFVNYASNSVLLGADCKKAAEEIGMKNRQFTQDVPTRWNSTFDMVERFLVNKEIVKKVLLIEKWKNKVKVKFTTKDFELAENISEVLSTFKEQTIMLSREEATLSQYLATIGIIVEKLGESDEASEPAEGPDSGPTHARSRGVVGLKKRLLKNLLERVGVLEESETYQLATLLDPRYKQWAIRSPSNRRFAITNLKNKLRVNTMEADVENNEELEEEEVIPVKSGFASVFARIRATEEQKHHKSNIPEVDNVEEVIDEYLNGELLETNKVLTFWKDYECLANGNKYKIALANLAKQYLTPPPTSTAVERLFSQGGNFLTEHRGSLSPDTVQMLMFLRSNMVSASFELDY